jgi:predicted nucleic acid-binding protein
MAVEKETASKLFIQQLIRMGSLTLCSSFVLVDEISADSDTPKTESILSFIKNVPNGIYVSDKNIEPIKETARSIIKTGVKEKDAVHVACAIYAECDCFLTVDKRLLKYKTDKLKMMNPIEFVKNWEKSNV